MKLGKWLGGGIGWALGGPVGAIFGFALGAMFDNANIQVETYTGTGHSSPRTYSGDFSASLLVLSAAVMKADGRILKSELEYVKSFFVKQFGVAYTQQQMLIFKEILNKPIPVADVCEQIKQNMQYAYRLQLLHYLFGLAKADHEVELSEMKMIQEISIHLGIFPKDFESIKAMFFVDVESDYKILEIERSATDEEIKKAYRRMAIKYHPDKLTHLGEEFQKAANEKFQSVQSAYENIKKKRGLN